MDLPYFPRPELLQSMIRLLGSGSNVTLFARRRSGKTMFLREELMPALSELGWFVARVDLWRNRGNPALGLVEGLEAVAHATRRRDSIFTRPLTLKTVKASFSPPGVDIEGEWEVATDVQVPPQATVENRLGAALALIAQRAPHVLLVFDEFQALAHGTHENVVASFRTALQDHDAVIQACFTGSSRAGLNALFRNARAPLFRSAMPVTLPELGDAFVDSRADYLQDLAGLEVDRDRFKAIFDYLRGTPLFLNEITRGALVGGTTDLDRVLEQWRRDKRENEYGSTLTEMKPAELAVVTWLATSGESSVYTEGARRAIGAFLGNGIASPSKVQAAIKRLTKEGLVEPAGGNGGYELADQGLQILLTDLAAPPSA